MEKKIIEILLLYGNEEVDFIDFTSETDEDGRKKIVKAQYSNAVCKEIYMHLQEDEIEFTNPVFLKIYYEMIHLLNQEQHISADLFTNHEDQEISSAVTDILMEEEKYSLSDWEKHDIYVKNKQSYLPKLVMDVLYNLRRLLIAEKIHVLKSELQEPEVAAVDLKDNQETLESIRDYTALKQLLFEKLNRVL
jgi:DNA primase